MLHAFLTMLAAEVDEEPSKTLWYVVGSVAAIWAVALAAIGLTRAEFPGNESGARVVMGISTVLVLAAMTAAVVSS